jgi:hypothetical protein
MHIWEPDGSVIVLCGKPGVDGKWDDDPADDGSGEVCPACLSVLFEADRDLNKLLRDEIACKIVFDEASIEYQESVNRREHAQDLVAVLEKMKKDLGVEGSKDLKERAK